MSSHCDIECATTLIEMFDVSVSYGALMLSTIHRDTINIPAKSMGVQWAKQHFGDIHTMIPCTFKGIQDRNVLLSFLDSSGQAHIISTTRNYSAIPVTIRSIIKQLKN